MTLKSFDPRADQPIKTTGREPARDEADAQDRDAIDERIRIHRASLDKLPRVDLAHLPTPLEDCTRLSAKLDGPAVMIKRDDCTGLAFGGNKVRQHEYILGRAIEEGADCLIQGSASQSNHSRQLAAAGAKLGLETFLLPKKDGLSSPVQGNLLIDQILGAKIQVIDKSQSTLEAKVNLADALRTAGRHPFITGMGANDSLTLAAVAYVDALFEIVEAMPAGQRIDWIYTASQGSTQAGLLVGCELLGMPIKVLGICPMTSEHEAFIPREGILELAHDAASLLGYASQLTLEDVMTTEAFVGEAYGVPTAEAGDAIHLLASTEGILLDPVYSAKAFAALVAHCRNGFLRPGQRVVFLHTGGLPALFAYRDSIVNLSGSH